MAFRPIADRFYQDAAYAIDAALTGQEDFDVRANGDLVAAGAALALERGAPRLIALSYDNHADDFLTHSSAPWRPFHGSVARYLETDENQSEAIKSPGEGVNMIVSEVLQRVSATNIVNAVSIRDFEQFMSPPQVELVQIARRNDDFRRDMNRIAVGDFQALSEDMAKSLDLALEAPIKDKLGEEVSLAQRAVNNVIDHDESMRRTLQIHGELAPQFSEVSRSSLFKVINYHREGISTGSEAIDATLDLLESKGRVPEDFYPDHPMIIAEARLIDDNRAAMSQNSSVLASMALTDAAIMSNARYDRNGMADQSEDISRSRRIEALATGRYHLLEDDDQFRIEADIVLARKTTALDKVSIEINYLEKVGIAQLDRAYFVAKESGAFINEETSREKMIPAEASKLIEAQRQSAALAQGMGL